jgi:hypothetical protein
MIIDQYPPTTSQVRSDISRGARPLASKDAFSRGMVSLLSTFNIFFINELIPHRPLRNLLA